MLFDPKNKYFFRLSGWKKSDFKKDWILTSTDNNYNYPIEKFRNLIIHDGRNESNKPLWYLTNRFLLRDKRNLYLDKYFIERSKSIDTRQCWFRKASLFLEEEFSFEFGWNSIEVDKVYLEERSNLWDAKNFLKLYEDKYFEPYFVDSHYQWIRDPTIKEYEYLYKLALNTNNLDLAEIFLTRI